MMPGTWKDIAESRDQTITELRAEIERLTDLLNEIEDGGDCRLYAYKSSAEDWIERRDAALTGSDKP